MASTETPTSRPSNDRSNSSSSSNVATAAAAQTDSETYATEQAQAAQRQRSGGGGSNSPTSQKDKPKAVSPPLTTPPSASGAADVDVSGAANAGSSSPSSSATTTTTPLQQQQQHQALPQQFCLRWNNYQSNLTTIFDQLLQNESFVDVTLACDGRSIKAHKMVLSACSPYFQTLLAETPCQHPIVIMRDVSWCDLKAIVEFMYRGEINVSQDQIGPLLRIAELLKVRGLADVTQMEEVNSAVAAAAATACSSPAQLSPKTPVERESSEELLSFMQPEKKLRSSDWDCGELRLSPQQQHHQQQQQSRNVRKRRWPSADAIFQAPASPLSSLIAAERLEQEQKERERQRDCGLLTPPPKQLGAGSGSLTPRRLTPAAQALETALHGMEMPSPATTPAPAAVAAAAAAAAASRCPRALPSPQQQQQQHLHHLQQQQQQQQHHISTSASSTSAESRFPLGSAAAMAAAAMELSVAAAEPRLPPPPPHHHSGPSSSASLADDMEIKPGIAEMIREEERVSAHRLSLNVLLGQFIHKRDLLSALSL